jgi:hypothetical protein
MDALDPLSAAAFLREASVKHEYKDLNCAMFQSCTSAHEHLLLDKGSDAWHIANTAAGPTLVDETSKCKCCRSMWYMLNLGELPQVALLAEVEKQAHAPGQSSLSQLGETPPTQEPTFSIVRVTDIIICVCTIAPDI